MIVIIQCAAKKWRHAGLLKAPKPDGRPVFFVADPEGARKALTDETRVYKKPDDIVDPAEPGTTWRGKLCSYNEQHKEDNPLALCSAYMLYTPSYRPARMIYRELVEAFGLERVYILSAGWGLIAADYLTPAYDITFTSAAEDYKQRRDADYKDFLLPAHAANEDFYFFGGREYYDLLYKTTSAATGRGTVFYWSKPAGKCKDNLALKRKHERARKIEEELRTHGWVAVQVEQGAPRTWHYDCAKRFCDTHGRNTA